MDISHPMLTELDTSQIIRSYIGVELTALDAGNIDAVSDDATESSSSGLHRDFTLDVSSSDDGERLRNL